MLFKQPVVGILGAAAFVVVGLFMSSLLGEVGILGKPYMTGYEPIRDSSKKIIGISYVGYMK